MKSPHSLEQAFLSLNLDSLVPGAVQAQALEVQGLYIAMNESGDFLCLVDDQREVSSPPRRLKVISVDYGIKYKAQLDNGEISGKFTVLKLGHQNSHLLLSFASLLSILTSALGERPSPQELQSFVEDFIELFAPKLGDPRERLKGLFGELYVIQASKNKRDFIQSWHESTNANKDFSFANAFLEVKTTEGKSRKHDFSASQLVSPFEGRPVEVASLLIEEDPHGQTIFQVMETLQSGLDHQLQSKLIKLVFETIGLDADDAHELKWNTVGEGNGIFIYAASELPTPLLDKGDPRHNAISSISFTLNFELLAATGVRHDDLSSFEQNYLGGT